MSLSATRRVYSDMLSFLSQSAICCIAATNGYVGLVECATTGESPCSMHRPSARTGVSPTSQYVKFVSHMMFRPYLKPLPP
jgi:hypothetical protein